MNMPAPTKMIPAAAVELGMYVAKLDREWLGSPFLFQGFYVRTEEEIRKLKTTCEHVYIDVEPRERKHGDRIGGSSKYVEIDTDNNDPSTGVGNSTEGGESRPALTVPSGSFLREIASSKGFVRKISRMFANMRPKASLKRELKRSIDIYSSAQSTVSNVMNELRAGGELDISCVKHTVAPMIKSVLRNPDAMACMVCMHKKDDYIYSHALATSVWAMVFGRHLGLDQSDLEALGTGGLLLDVGKTKISSELLHKNGQLEKEEYDELQRHVEYGLQILDESNNVDSKVKAIVHTHHERHNGSGYPQGLAGNDIPVFGRITGLVDTYDALTSVRPYAAAMSTYDAMRYLLDNANILFQAEIVERFIQVAGMFPTGTLIELNTGEVGIIVKQNPVRRLRPAVMLILDKDKNRRDDFPIVELKDMSPDANDPNGVWIVRGLDFGAFGIDPTAYYL